MRADPTPIARAVPPLPLDVDPAVSVSPVRTTSERDAFVRFQIDLLGHDQSFVPPIAAERSDFLDRNKNPFFQHAEAELFLARRNGRIVGRIAAINDSRYNHFHNAENGFFGFFDCENDPAAATALLSAAGDWLRRKGLKLLVGPVNLSFNHDCGVLVEGFDQPPAMMLPYNPPYYDTLIRGCGLTKQKDLWTYEMSTAMAPPERVVRVAEKLREQDGVVVRPIDMKNLSEEIRRIKNIYNAMLEPNWGFVPMSEEEFDAIANRLRPLVQIRPELCLIAEVKGEPVAFVLTLPDSNVALKAAGGRLTRFGLPLGLAKLFWAARSIDRVRVLLLGIKPGFRRRGIDALLFLDTIHGARKLGYLGGELGWTPEDNDLINRAIESMGARRFRTYRVYEKALV